MNSTDVWPSDLEEIAFLIAQFAPFDVVVDGGANEGIFTRALQPHSNLVIAIEPQRDLARKLRELYLKRVSIEEAALSDETSLQWLACSRTVNRVASLDKAWADKHHGHLFEGDGYYVPVTTLPCVLSNRGLTSCDLLKLDLEGYDVHALRGLLRSGMQHPRVIMVEVYLNEPSANEIRALLNDAGYNTSRLFTRIDGVLQESYTISGYPILPSGEPEEYANLIAWKEA